MYEMYYYHNRTVLYGKHLRKDICDWEARVLATDLGLYGNLHLVCPHSRRAFSLLSLGWEKGTLECISDRSSATGGLRQPGSNLDTVISYLILLSISFSICKMGTNNNIYFRVSLWVLKWFSQIKDLALCWLAHIKHSVNVYHHCRHYTEAKRFKFSHC